MFCKVITFTIMVKFIFDKNGSKDYNKHNKKCQITIG